MKSSESMVFPLNILPEVRTAGRFSLDEQGFKRIYRSNSHAIHVHMYAGKIRLGDRDYTLRPGDLTITPANLPSAYHLPEPGFHWCAHVNPSQGNGATSTLPLHASLGALAEHAGEKILTIGRWMSTGGALGTAASSAAALELMLWLAAQTSRSPADQPPTRGVLAARQIATIIQTRFAEPLYVPDLADEVELSQNHLAKVFHGWYGMTIQRYLLNRRIDAARHLLMASSIPIHRVAARVGLEDRQYFNKQFRRIVGVSPSAFRDQASKPPARQVGTRT